MNRSQRIKVNLGRDAEHHIKVRLDQSVDNYEILSLNIDQKDIYQSFNSDYGVIIGRVNANQSVGVPNAKVSIFIPISDSDLENEKISSIYPYTSPRDQNNSGKRYNLLPRVAKEDPDTGIFKPKQPFGSMPTKEELVTNETWLEVYEKYYKYTTVTNESGDYMLFGVPIGIQTVHISVDLTDIGSYSMTPSSMVKTLGYSPNLFTADSTLVKPQNDLNDLPHIETQEISVDVIPFWGDINNFEIGITRQDFRIRAQIEGTFTVFGHVMCHGAQAYNGNSNASKHSIGFYRVGSGQSERITTDARTLRTGKPTIYVLSYLPNININDVDEDLVDGGDRINTKTDIYQLSENDYYYYEENGQFAITIPNNRSKIATDEFGNIINVNDDEVGVYSEFYGMFFIEFEDLPMDGGFDKFEGPNPARKARGRIKIPQGQDDDKLFGLKWYNENSSGYKDTDGFKQSEKWRKNYHKFELGKLYSVAQFMATKYGRGEDTPDDGGYLNNLDYGNIWGNVGGIIKTGGYDYIEEKGDWYITEYGIDEDNYVSKSGDPISGETESSIEFNYDLLPNAETNTYSNTVTDYYFGGQWLNFTIFIQQYLYALGDRSRRPLNCADIFVGNDDTNNNNRHTHYLAGDQNNNQHLIADLYDTRWIMFGKSNRTSFIEIPKSDLTILNNHPNKGINIEEYNEDPQYGGELVGSEYKYLKPIDNNTGDYNFTVAAQDTYYTGKDRPYLFKDIYKNDCIKLLFDLNLV